MECLYTEAKPSSSNETSAYLHHQPPPRQLLLGSPAQNSVNIFLPGKRRFIRCLVLFSLRLGRGQSLQLSLPRTSLVSRLRAAVWLFLLLTFRLCKLPMKLLLF